METVDLNNDELGTNVYECAENGTRQTISGHFVCSEIRLVVVVPPHAAYHSHTHNYTALSKESRMTSTTPNAWK
ncbi:Uncharacterized protein FWK35_00017279 [Aphis craccivora]|uniref:Uncharacterized protein n=1 Tax=Aphis craccivora TaxID=307492 RepID=A0A6G0YHU8_APHCR|nr:Uncharacterized protein FWK35_00017279 [Aphis craccivora]